MLNVENLYPHNKKILIKLLENLKTYNKVGVVQATGTGKGKLATCLIDRLFRNNKNSSVLIIAPLRSILQNYKANFNLLTKGIDYTTYQKIEKMSFKGIELLTQEYDLIILDEYHRCGAKEWFKKIKHLLNNIDENNCKVVGLTATPIRYLDNSRDMSEELFDGNIIEGVNLEEAIIDGILPSFTYNACYFGTKELFENIIEDLKVNKYKISNNSICNDFISKISKLSLDYENKYKIENIIKSGTKDLGKNQKWVIFCKDKENLEEVRKLCLNWFNEKPNLYIMYSDRSELDNDKTLSDFRSIKKGINVLLCINMLNEGVHVSDLNGVIMLRKTDSPILFMQQLGRSLEVGKEFNPIIFDLIGNYRGLKIKENELEVNTVSPISIIKNIEKKTKNKKNYIIIHNFTEDLDNVLDELSRFIFKYSYWTPEEDEILRTYYENGGVKLCIEHGLNRDGGSINHRARYIGLRYIDNSAYWTLEEIEIIRKYYKQGGWRLCWENGLQHKTQRQIYSKAGKLGLAEKVGNVHYTEKEDNIIKEFYLIGGAKLCQDKGVNRTIYSISRRALDLGIRDKEKLDKWTELEDNILRKYYCVGGYQLCQEKGINRNRTSILNRANRLNLLYNIKKKWTFDEDEIIKKYYRIGGYKLCQEKGLKDRNAQMIFHRARILGV